jgi:hypothetical protein
MGMLKNLKSTCRKIEWYFLDYFTTSSSTENKEKSNFPMPRRHFPVRFQSA